jgi:hypothetical protein
MHMKPPPVRGLGLLLVGALAAAGQVLAPPSPVLAEQQAIAIPGPVSSISAGYGPAIPLEALATGHYLIPTSTGFEVRIASHAAGDPLVATFRSAGVFPSAALAGSTAWLAAGEQGLLAVSLAVLDAPVSIGAHGGLGAVRCVAFAPSGQAVAAATDSVLHFFRETVPGALAPLGSRAYADGRRLRRIAARNDSFLVAAERPGPIPRLYLTLYRVRDGARPESLWDFQSNGHMALDLAWSGATAFIADGNTGVLPFRLATRQLRPAVPLSGGRYVTGLDADDALVVVVGQGRTLATFDRAGALADSLVNETDHLLVLEPNDVSIVAGHALVSSASESTPGEPDEVGRSAIEDHDLAAEITLAPVGGTGRVRRVAYDRGYAFVADYTGGFRVYRAAGPDTSLVGVLPPSPVTSRVYDVALDRTRKVAYIAAGTGGVQVVDVGDPSVPALLGAAALPGLTLCVAVVDTELVVAGWSTGPGTGGVTMIGVTSPASPVVRGSASIGAGASIASPRAIAVRDTLAFVADPLWGVVSVGFGDPDAPGIVGVASGVVGTRDIDIAGNTLLAATGQRGVQVVDVSQPNRLVLLAEVPLPGVLGVAQQGTSAVAFLGASGAVALDLTRPSFPGIGGTIALPGIARDGAWAGDTLLVATSYGLERVSLKPALPASPALSLRFDPDAATGRVDISWPPLPPTWAAGLDLLRYTVTATGGGGAVQINGSLLPASSTATTDPSASPGVTYRYVLQALLPDGGLQEVAEGEIFISSTTRVGRAFPNPWRPSLVTTLAIPFSHQAAVDGAGRSATARIYNVQGRLVRALEATVPAEGGFGSLAWDGRDDRGVPAPSGVYYIHVRAPGVNGSCRALVLR